MWKSWCLLHTFGVPDARTWDLGWRLAAKPRSLLQAVMYNTYGVEEAGVIWRVTANQKSLGWKVGRVRPGRCHPLR